MADPRFFKKAGPFSLAELAAVAGAELGAGADPALVISDVGPLDEAGEGTVSFLDNKKYLPDFEKTAAAACIVEPGYADKAPSGVALLLTDKPYKAYALIAQHFYPRKSEEAGAVHPSAIIDETSEIGEGCSVGPGAVLGRNVKLGPNCSVEANAVIGDGVEIGEGTTVGPTASLEYCIVGSNCQIHAGVRIGNRGFGFAMDPAGYVDVPQLGRVIIEDDVEIGANSTIDRGAGPDTIIGQGTKIDNLVQIGHNVRLGKRCVIVAQSGVAGSSVLDDYVVMGAQSGVNGHIHLGTGVQVAGKSGVMRSVEAGQSVAGVPAMPIKEFFRLCTLWQKQLKKKGK